MTNPSCGQAHSPSPPLCSHCHCLYCHRHLCCGRPTCAVTATCTVTPTCTVTATGTATFICAVTPSVFTAAVNVSVRVSVSASASVTAALVTATVTVCGATLNVCEVAAVPPFCCPYCCY